MSRREPPDVTNQPDRVNIERIVKYLGQLGDGAARVVPGDVLDAIEGLLARAEVAERQLEQLRSEARQSREGRRKEQRERYEELSYVCRMCGQTVVTMQLVGSFRPSVCGSEWCRREARQQDARERQRRLRERRQIK